ncbi:MAG TPA: hypothetical protein VNJ01_01920 [Bacteriovoracaceae bacterium]|nr:hypothetical protein [Bacteriovoracaceae bacterium]
MLGLVTLGLTVVMIYTLVKNALIGKQLDSKDVFNGNVELIIPIATRSEFYLEPWMAALSSYKLQPSQLKIHILIDGHHPSFVAWNELKEKLPYVELHSFMTRPEGREAIPWMIEQISPRITADVVIIGDAELVPTEHAFHSLAKLVSEKQKPYFVLPQTAKINIFGEAVATLNPTLALVSVFGFKKFRRNISHPLMSIAQGWMGMTHETFMKFDFSQITVPSWKEALARQWDTENKTYILAFGEKHLRRYYPDDLKIQIFQMKTNWEELWSKGDHIGLGLFICALFIWSFPVVCFFTHPFWSLASIILLMLYRFFSKIVFQESWPAIFMHPFGCLVWIGTFIWWSVNSLRAKYSAESPV